MRSFAKFLVLLAAVALLVVMLVVKPSGDINVFFGVWVGAMILLAVPVLVILGFGMTAGEVIKELDRRVTRLWTSHSSGSRQSNAPIATSPPHRRSRGFMGKRLPYVP